jgi:hypothetical protein
MDVPPSCNAPSIRRNCVCRQPDIRKWGASADFPAATTPELMSLMLRPTPRRKNCYVTARSKNAYPMRCIDTLRRRNHLHLQTASPLWAKLRRSVASALRRSREPRTLPRGRKHLIRNLVYAESKVDRLSQDDDSSCPLRKTRSTLPLRLQCCAYAPIDSLRLGHQGTRKRDKIRNFALLKENIERS